MCGIIGYTGGKSAIHVLTEGLKRLEYRGYDSCGLATVGPAGVYAVKTCGTIGELELRLSATPPATTGIGHTRWATHGRPSEANAHPHCDCGRTLYVIHNGIIENYSLLKRELMRKGHRFESETDTEVLAHLFEEFYQGDLLVSVLRGLERVTGTFGIAVVHAAHPDQIIVARRGSPLVLGVGDREMLAASDVAALLRHTDRVIYLNDGEVAVLQPDDFRILSISHELVHRDPVKVEWQVEETEKNGFPHFMLKEIFEQPETVLNAFRGRILREEGVSKFGGLESILPELKKINRLVMISCGTSYHAGLLGRYIFEKLTDINVDVEIASEFRYRNINLSAGTAVLAISQSGETADTIAAVREARRKGALALGLVNVVGSTIARETIAGVYNHAGPEIGVASTKIFTSQVVILSLLALLLGRFKKLSMNDGIQVLNAIQELPDQIHTVLEQSEDIRTIARDYYQHQSFLYLGRLYNYPTAMEGALKLKEISYIHAEGYPAGEMKHGPIALISPECPVMAVCPRDSVYDKMISNIMEVQARGAKIIAVGSPDDTKLADIADRVITVPRTLDFLNPVLCNIPLQLFAYFCALYRGCAIDKPRNLAKSVTVE
ncbi:MAG TPA: glutamine--fructose-6-phosphate transaminase (isomerizing) [Acidobacteriota bacterium]|nr:glutamine--fructose-6-phosphate transaminase (isomerizing) [Acidobacteriota bacterium]HNR38204.1 glutamine--fructose-6-phosphate transaminase (isomerizing) [Acidobacteriota bacterium]HNT99836.1 glutamine--fructose-6-phosphate transaminase (isomerizing) [Acidobacteriota bacterium]